MKSFHVHYQNTRTELCKIGAKYDTDKSSQRNGVSNVRHCHPYTCFYHTLFGRSRDRHVSICEFGILQGASLKMWREYFHDVSIYGYEYNTEFIQDFLRDEYTNVPPHIRPFIRPVILNTVDVRNRENIAQQLASVGATYDVIIEDTTHQMDDQINVVLEATKYLNAGGIFIVEDIFLKYTETEYLERLRPIIESEYQDAYFITLDHANRNSHGWDNDKLLVLVKKGEPIFVPQNKITFITPSIRPQNIPKMAESIDFRFVDKWIIVYDGAKLNESPDVFGGKHPQIYEYLVRGTGISGNPQRNFALDLLARENANTFVYFLDDDNLCHPSLYSFLSIIDKRHIYTFNTTMTDGKIIEGNNPAVGYIDSSQLLVDFSLINQLRWEPHLYHADGVFAENVIYLNPNKWIWINAVMAYYNTLTTP